MKPNNLDKITEKTIEEFALQLKKDLNDKIKTERNLKSSLFNEILKDILKHPYKKDVDIYILNTFLKSLKKFMNIIRSENSHYDIDNILSKISANLEPLQVEQNNMLMRIGEPGDFFYIILSGQVSVLVPKVISIYMSHEQYIHHLKILYNNEPYLYEGTIKLHTKTSYFINQDEIQKDENFILSGNNKPRSLEDYIAWMNGEKIIDKSSIYHKEVKIMGYFKVTDLYQGNSFGEIALIDQKHLRTASIYVTDNSFFGKLSANAYKKSMRKIQEKIKRENIDFVFSSQLFNQISLKFFSQSYWNYFINRKISKGDFIFKEGHERDEIYFIHEGEIKIKSNLNSKKIEKIFESIIPKYKQKRRYLKENDEMRKSNEIVISYGKKGNILGLGDLLYEGRFFCDAICDSLHCSFFAINLHIFLSIAKIFEGVLESFKALEDNKKKIMINRLNTIKFAYQNSLLGEHHLEDGIITKSGKEIKFEDWFDYDKNFVYKTCYCKRKKVFVNINKLKEKNFSPMIQKIKTIKDKKNHKMNNISRNEKKTFSLIPSDYTNNNTKVLSKINYTENTDGKNNKNKSLRTMIISLNQREIINHSLKKFMANRPISKLDFRNFNSFNKENKNNINIYKDKIILSSQKISKIQSAKIKCHHYNFSNDDINNIVLADSKFVSNILKNRNDIKNKSIITPFNYTSIDFKPLSNRVKSNLFLRNITPSKEKKVRKYYLSQRNCFNKYK